jgi:hypothetical protein
MGPQPQETARREEEPTTTTTTMMTTMTGTGQQGQPMSHCHHPQMTMGMKTWAPGRTIAKDSKGEESKTTTTTTAPCCHGDMDNKRRGQMLRKAHDANH